jgi:uncharacterized protein (TIGR02246 family)
MLRADLRRWSFPALLLTLCACSSQSGSPAATIDTRAADEAAIRAATEALGPVVEAKDLEKAVAPYTDDAVLFVPKAPAAVGKDAIRAAVQGMLAAPALKMTFNVTSIEVARSGDLALERGAFQVVTADKDGKPTTETGQVAMVWRKQADGMWKVVADTSADDQ